MNCYILVGGESRRMGTPKDTTAFGGGTMLDRVVVAASRAFERVVAVDRPGPERPLGLRTTQERPHGASAPVFGVQRALEDAGKGKVWILAVDYPLITAEILRDLRRRFEAGDGSMLIPKWNGKMQMLCAGYSASLLPRIAERIRTGQIDLRGLASTESTQIIEEEELRRSYPGEPLMNVNTPEELETARRLDGQGKE